MHEFREKKRLRKLLYSNISIIVLLLLILLIAKGVWSIYGKEHEAYLDRVDVESQVASLQSREGFLKKEINALATTNGVDLEIRDKFNVKKPGEEVAVIVNSTSTLPAATNAPMSFPEELTGQSQGLLGR